MDDSHQNARIGFYICHCGVNIACMVDCAGVAAYAAKLPGVVVSRDYKYMCSDPGQELIRQDVQEHDLNRIVVASCSPLLHEHTFRNATARAGLNPFYFQMVNVREHDAWVHTDRQAATDKAKALARAAIYRVVLHKALMRKKVPINPNVLVVGGGIAGIHAALTLADPDKKVYLVEREPSIGGHMARFDKTFPTLDCAACILTPKMTAVGTHPNIELRTYSEVKQVSGYIGNFKASIRRKARFVDTEKCTSCGRCLERCPVQFKPDSVEHAGNGEGYGLPVLPRLPEPVKTVVDRALGLHQHERASLISVLQDINIDLGYLPADALRYVSRSTGVPLVNVYHVATFYKAFSLTPRGEHVIRVCLGTACHVRGAARVLEALETRLDIKSGQTTKDLKFTLETVNCLGACAMGPVATVDGEFMTLTPGGVNRLLKRLATQPAQARAASPVEEEDATTLQPQ
jgi:NADH:ubiquinone oxidoreductase subunit E/NAD-dependent dihydropyrimidine dehydrogenase PreA subunit